MILIFTPSVSSPAPFVPSNIHPTVTPYPQQAVMTLTALGYSLTATEIINQATNTMQAELQAQFTPPAPEAIDSTLTQVIDNATQGTLSLVVTPPIPTP